MRPVNEEEAKAVFEFVNQFVEAISKLRYKEGLVAKHLKYDPALALEFRVEQIFDQTPKVGAGKQIAAV